MCRIGLNIHPVVFFLFRKIQHDVELHGCRERDRDLHLGGALHSVRPHQRGLQRGGEGEEEGRQVASHSPAAQAGTTKIFFICNL
jgi:hypothetical protein